MMRPRQRSYHREGSNASMLNPEMGLKCLRLLVSSVMLFSMAVAATSAPPSCSPCDRAC